MLQAGAIADGAIASAQVACQPGVSESAVAAQIQQAMEGSAPGATCYGAIVASGPHSALPHHHTGSRALQTGDIVVLDYGCTWHGYHSDITLTVSLGPPGEEAR